MWNYSNRSQLKFFRAPSQGFTLIELMIVVAIIAIILTLALPVYSNYSIRAKVSEAISVAAAAKTATSSTCVEDPTIAALDNSAAGYGFESTKYVENIEISGPCTAPVVTLTTRQTGAVPDIVVTLNGDFTGGAGRVNWSCSTDANFVYVPGECRNSS